MGVRSGGGNCWETGLDTAGCAGFSGCAEKGSSSDSVAADDNADNLAAADFADWAEESPVRSRPVPRPIGESGRDAKRFNNSRVVVRCRDAGTEFALGGINRGLRPRPVSGAGAAGVHQGDHRSCTVMSA